MKQIELEKTGDEHSLSRSKRFYIFVILVLITVVLAGENGVVSSCSDEIKRDLKLSEKEYGLFASLPIIGRIFGSLIFMFILSVIDNRKIIMHGVLIIAGLMYCVFNFTTNKYILYLVRFIIGIVRIYPHIYNDMWVNQFGFQKYKTIMLTAIKIMPPLGQGFGYIIGTFIPEGKYSIGFTIISICLAVLFLLLLPCSSKYFHSKYYFVGYIDNKRLVKFPTERTDCSYFRKVTHKKQRRYHGLILNILDNGAYLTSIYVGANLKFIFEVIHSNIKSYCSMALGLTDKKELLKYYVPASVLGPSLGGLFGGIIATLMGGYPHPNSSLFVLLASVLTLMSIIPVALAPTVSYLGKSLFVFFFFASGLLPVTEGWAQMALPIEFSGAGASFKMFITNFFGNALGPMIYGYLLDGFKEVDASIPWKITMGFYILGFISAILAVVFNYRFLKEKLMKSEGKTKDKNIQYLDESLI